MRTTGIVTSVGPNLFVMQDPAGDGRNETSDAIVVVVGGVPSVVVSDFVVVMGDVIEDTPGGVDTKNQPTTKLVNVDAHIYIYNFN